MNKKFLPFAVVALILAAGISYWYLYQQNSEVTAVPDSVATTTVPAVVSDTKPPATNSSIKTAVTLYDTFFKEGTDISKVTPYINPITHDRITFTLLTDTAHQTQYFSSDAFVNGTRAGEVGGNQIAMTTFSPGNTYFAFRTQGPCGAGCENVSLYVVNLKTRAVVSVLPPVRSSERTPDTAAFQGGIASPLIDSYSWKNDTTLLVEFSFVGVDSSTGISYQASPIQEWTYDIPSGTYTPSK